MKNTIFAFDFSMNKPAMSVMINDTLTFYVWPSAIDKTSYEKLQDCGVNIVDRGLEPIKKMNESNLILEHVTRAKNLADMIVGKMIEIVDDNNVDKNDVIVSNEGFAFSAKGDAALDLSGYKYILMSKLIDNGFTNFKTFSPITLKATAGCSKKDKHGKTCMIDALADEDENLNTFIYMIKHHPDALKKKTSYCLCVDDIADSYWCLKTTIQKLNLI